MHEHYAGFGDKLPAGCDAAARGASSSGCGRSRARTGVCANRRLERADAPRTLGMALPFIPSDAAVLALQAGVVAAPRRPPEMPWIKRLRGPGWALIPIALDRRRDLRDPLPVGYRDRLTYLALIAVPLLAAAALGWAPTARARGWRCWPRRCSRSPGRADTLAGEAAAALLVGAQLRHARRAAGARSPRRAG